MIKQVRLFLFFSFQRFFMKNKNNFLLSNIGKIYYLLGFKLSVFLLKKIPELDSIYLLTDINNVDIGTSDIDMRIVFRNVSLDKEIYLLKRFYEVKKFITFFFPFMADILFYFKRDFITIQENTYSYISRKAKGIKYWELVYGTENRIKLNIKEAEIYSKLFRMHYENALMDIYANVLGIKKTLRTSYKKILENIRMIFILKTGRDADDTEEYKKFLYNYGFDKEFLEQFFLLPLINFSYREEFLYSLAFYNLKLLEIANKRRKIGTDIKLIKKEPIKEKKEILNKELIRAIKLIDKKQITSIYILKTGGFYKDENILYVILKNSVSLRDFKIFFKSFLGFIRRLDTLKKDISKKGEATLKKFILLPLIFSEAIIKKSIAIGGLYTLEPLHFNLEAKKLFGHNLKMDYDLERIKISNFEFLSKTMFIPGISDLVNYPMALRLLLEKKIACFSNIKKEYEKHFKDIVLKSESIEDKYMFMRKIFNKIYYNE